MKKDECFLCGRNGNGDPLDWHHIFGGSRRAMSERLGLKVPLCHHRCHIFGQKAVHQNREVRLQLQAHGQQLAMAQAGLSLEQFMALFGKNYLKQAPHNAPDNTVNDFGPDERLELPDWEVA